MVVMDGLARDIGVLAAGQVDALDRPQFGQDVECPEDRRATDAQAAHVRVGHEVSRSEVALAALDQVHHRTPRCGGAVAGPAQGCVDGGRDRVHFVMILSINTVVQPVCPICRGTPNARDLGPAVNPERQAQTLPHGIGPSPGHGGLMTLEIGSQKIGRIGRRGTRVAPSLPIGEIDANIFGCPACSRPLDSGTRRCPGCATRLIAGVKATRAVAFVALGALGGTLLGAGLVMAIAFTSARPADVVVVPAPAVVTPSQVPIPNAPAPVADSAIPSSALSALRQSTLLSQRVLDDAARLSAALSSAKPMSSEIAPILRSMAWTATFGQRLAPTVGDWDQGTVLSADLVTFYAAIGRTADEGLSSSLSSGQTYEAAGERMLKIVAGLDALDGAARGLAATAGVDLPPLISPTP